jgi:hypothetical protein
MNKKKIIWLVSYPKSGNTWIRNILANSLFKNNSLDIDIHARNKDIYCEHGERIIMKSHFPWPLYHNIQKRMPNKHYSKQISRLLSDTIGYIYIYRNPLDVLVSALYYLGDEEKMSRTKTWGDDFLHHKKMKEYTQEELQKILDIFTFSGNIPAFSNAGYGTWEENVNSWLMATKKIPVLFVKYEDALADSAGMVRKIARFSHYGDTEASFIDKVVEENSIKSMRDRADSSFKFFFRKGEYGDYVNHFSDDQILNFYSRNKVFMDKLAYRYT